MEVSYRLHVVGDQPTREAVLPDLPGSSTYEPGVLDRFGEQVQRSWPLLASGGVLGAAAGVKLLGGGGGVGGILRGVLGGVAGAVLGTVATGSTLAALRGIDGHRAPQSVRGGEVADPTVGSREQLKVMTYNVHGGMGGPKEFFASEAELDELADVIRREQPDVLLLQEVDRFATRSNHVDVLAALADRLGADSAVGGSASTAITGRDQHVAVLTFNGNTISDARNIIHADPRGGGFGVRAAAWLRDVKAAAGSVVGRQWNAGERYQVRNTVEAMVRTPDGNAVRVLSGHYEWPSETVDHQRRQVASIAGALDAWDGPTIWGADFNVQASSDWAVSERRAMADAGLRDAFEAVEPERRVPVPERGTHPDRPIDEGGGIDRIYVSGHANVLDARVVREAGDASDHLPVVAHVELRPDGAGR